MEEQILITMRDITKTFPGVVALDHAQLTLRKGEIHALMGENGAGKSTIIKCLTGVYERDAGEIHMAGIEGNIFNHSTQEAQKIGIATVYQEVNLCPNLSVAENLFIGREPRTKLGMVDWKVMNRKARKIMDDLKIRLDVTNILENYSLAIQQMVAIARAVDMDCKVLILDEPTSSLDDTEVAKLFHLMRGLKKKGVGILFVTHFLEQVYEVCDRITVMRNGKFVNEYDVAELPRMQLVAAMLGKDFDDLATIKPEGASAAGGELVVEARNLSHKGTIKPFDFEIRKGEVVGVTGLLGSGRSEMVRCIYGVDRAQTGTEKMHGKDLKINAPIDSIKAGMGFLPDDRKADGCFAELSVRENIILALQARQGLFHTLPMAKQNELADQFIDLLQIKTPSRETPLSQLSGGNQQKVILARWLCTHPDFLILDEPTRGIDIGTKTEFQRLVLKFASEGMSIVFISSEIDEMLRTCSRMCVMRDGAKVGEIDGEMTQESVMAAIAGGEQQ
ncbi:Fructose import ATP-binding protein FruK [Caprobacter fermentans]|uniref:Fructose import ATP-binding protein FruK n=1 Tax=Caproicibacter fermentans TaxID=2576756 RepID=A0A6N8HWF5_9FIRM|nr:sugar ABC transporter ATP-binding protein [Caproicibacter fermentans]MVB09880.1 Fructose import ATP-binding protein FruK [Caproicibacter fermentans]OCN00336.1 sugar ABC transporter ATP-binding protein [Clostridium sp. W14A]QNK42161.1 sugar ABC transporter ATP-binding protein [Caproicibacter fermentans]